STAHAHRGTCASASAGCSAVAGLSADSIRLHQPLVLRLNSLTGHSTLGVRCEAPLQLRFQRVPHRSVGVPGLLLRIHHRAQRRAVHVRRYRRVPLRPQLVRRDLRQSSWRSAAGAGGMSGSPGGRNVSPEDVDSLGIASSSSIPTCVGLCCSYTVPPTCSSNASNTTPTTSAPSKPAPATTTTGSVYVPAAATSPALANAPAT